MNISKRLVVVGIVLLIAVWTGNIIFYNRHVLKEPIFMRHYYDIREGMGNFSLYYITNINDEDKVFAVTFPELDNENLPVQEVDQNTDGRYYRIKALGINIFQGSPEQIPDNLKNKLITKAQVHFSSGKIMNVDIGRIYLYSSGSTGTPALKSNFSSGSSDNTGSSRFVADKDIKITGINCRFPELINNGVELTLNSKSLNDIAFPMEIKNKENLMVNYSFSFDKNDIRRNDVYEFPIDILTEDSNGIKGYCPIYMNYWRQFPDEYDIKALKGRGDE